METHKIPVDPFVYKSIKHIIGLKTGEKKQQLLEELFAEIRPKAQRTSSQNKALHVYFALLSDKLNEMGLDMRMILKPTYQIWWTQTSVKENLWKPLQKSMLHIESTTDLEKHVDIDKVHEQLMEMLGKKWGVEYIPFPVDPKKQKEFEM